MKASVALDKINMDEVALLESFMGNQKRLAEAMSVSRPRIGKWRKGERPDEDNREKLAALTYLVTVLLNNFDLETAEDWIFGLNAHLQNQRPIDLIKKNKIIDVISAAKQTIAGSYA